MTTHYELLGVEPDASRNEIRSAYRARVDELDGALAEPKRRNVQSLREEKARLNAAWTVLADPYQRGRYDEQLGVDEPDGDGPVDGDDAPVAARPPARSGFRERMRRGAESFDRAETAGATGAEPAPVMKRLGGAMIDVLVMSGMITVVLFGVGGLGESGAAFAVALVAALVVFGGATIWPVGRNGRTIGHRLTGLRVVMDDGEPVTTAVAARRYGIPVALAAAGLVEPVLQMLALLAGLSFLFSQHRVSILDRIAHTRVVVAST